MSEPITAEARLADLFATLFRPERDPGPLRTWLGRCPDTAVVLPELPGLLASAADLCAAVASTLRARGLTNSELFARLISGFPDQDAAIRGVAPSFGAEPAPSQIAAYARSAPPPAEQPLPVPAADLSRRKPISASVEWLRTWIAQERPVLWVGAGTSVAAGMPSTAALVEAMIRRAIPEDPEAANWRSLPFFDAADHFVESQGKEALHALLQREIGHRTPRLTPTLRSIAALAKTGSFSAILTTNYDDAIEMALREAGVPMITRGPDANEGLRPEGAIELVKLHGSRESWERVVLTGESYRAFATRYPYWPSELDVLLRKQPILFVGCSMQDPRVLTWLVERPEGWDLRPWRALLTDSEWAALRTASWQRGAVSGAIARSEIRPVILQDHAQLDEMFGAIHPDNPDDLRIELTLVASAAGWHATSPQLGTWTAVTPELKPLLEHLHPLMSTALPTDDRGQLSPAATGIATRLRELAVQVGEGLAAALLPPEPQSRLAAMIERCPATHPALLTVRVSGDAADGALSLPWELLRIGGRFPVEDGRLDIAREAVVDGLLGLDPPSKPLTVVATVAAPIDQQPLDYEEESYRLWRAMGALESRLYFTHQGTLAETVRAVRRARPTALHFTGHGLPGALLFEDETARGHEVPVDTLIGELSGAEALPRLVFLASCYGASMERGGGGPGQRQLDPATLGSGVRSTAASLHRAGFPQVIAYFGPVGDAQSTRVEATVYRRLAAGGTTRQAVHEARRQAATAHKGPNPHLFPLGWAQIALYLRGDPTMPLATAAEPSGDAALEARWDRTIERLDAHERGASGIAGVQWLRFGFVGRRGPRADLLRRWFGGARLLVVAGLGGLGKTALCVEVLQRLRDETRGRVLALDGRTAGLRSNPALALWRQVQAADEGDAWNDTLARIQQRDGLTGVAVVAAIRALADRGGHLLVYLDDAESLQEAPTEGAALGRWRGDDLRAVWDGLVALAQRDGNVTVMASSRYRPEGTPEDAALDLPEMPRLDMIRLLRWFPTLGQVPAEEQAWLAGRLDGHPRTVELLEAVVKGRVDAVTPIGGRYGGRAWRAEILDPALPEAAEKIRANLLLPRVLDAVGTAAVDHLGRCALLAAPAPWGAIVAVEDVPGTGRVLQSAGLLSPYQSADGEADGWAPHALVVDAVRDRWTGDVVAAHRRLGAWFAEEAKRSRTWLADDAAVHHLLAAGDANGAWEAGRLRVLSLRDAGRYREALTLVERVLAGGSTGPALGIALALRIGLSLSSGSIPADAEEVLTRAEGLVGPDGLSFVLYTRAEWARMRGDFATAARALEADLANEIAAKGEAHRDVAASLHALAGVLQAQGDLSGARARLERALAIKAAVLGTEEHPDFAASLHELAGVLQAQGDLLGARTRLERSLTIKAAFFGTDEHPSVAASLHALGGVLRTHGDLVGARERLERSLAIKAVIFGTDTHPDVAASLHMLAGVLQALGDLPGARDRLERSLAIMAAVFGTQMHPDVAASLHALAGVLAAQGDLPGARERLERVLEINEAVFGTGAHPRMAASLHALARVLKTEGNLPEARARLERALAIQDAVYGTEEHPDVAATLHELAGVLAAQGDLPGARRTLERTLQVRQRLFGTREHYTTAVSEVNLAQILFLQGERDEAVALLHHALEVFHAALPPGHPLIRRALEILTLATDPTPHGPTPGAAAAPYALGALAACSPVPVALPRLQHVALRVLLWARARNVLPLVFSAAAAAGDPGLVVTHPRSIPPPPGLSSNQEKSWTDLLGKIADVCDEFTTDLHDFLPLLPTDPTGRILPTAIPLPAPDDDDRRALIDEALAVVHAAHRDGDLAVLHAERDLWAHAARTMLTTVAGPESVTLARDLLALLPDDHATLLAAWSDVLTEDQRAWLGS